MTCCIPIGICLQQILTRLNVIGPNNESLEIYFNDSKLIQFKYETIKNTNSAIFQLLSYEYKAVMSSYVGYINYISFAYLKNLLFRPPSVSYPNV